MVHEEQLNAYVTSEFVAGRGHKDHDLKVTEEVLKDALESDECQLASSE